MKSPTQQTSERAKNENKPIEIRLVLLHTKESGTVERVYEWTNYTTRENARTKKNTHKIFLDQDKPLS